MRIGTCLALRRLEASELMVEQHKPFLFETPKRRPIKLSLSKLPRAIELVERDGVSIKEIMQCMLGPTPANRRT